MTTFAQAGSQAGILYLPAELIGAVPAADGPWRDQELLALPAARVAELDADTLIDALAAARRLRARADALEARALDGLDRLRDGSRYVADEAALELRITRHAAADRLDRALNLVRRLPNVLAAMDAGELEGYPAGQIGRITAHLSDEDAREVDRRLAAKHQAGTLNLTDPVRLRRTVRRLVQRIDPDGQLARARAARRERDVQLRPGEDTMSTLIATLPAEVAACAYARVDGLARTLRNAGDQRTLDQLRADAAPRSVLSYPLWNREGFGGRSLGLMAYLDLKGKGNNSMSGNQWSCPGVRGGALGGPRDTAKAGLPKP